MTEIADIWQNNEEPLECKKRVMAKAQSLGLNFDDFDYVGNDLKTGVTTYTDDAGFKERMKIVYGM